MNVISINYVKEVGKIALCAYPSDFSSVTLLKLFGNRFSARLYGLMHNVKVNV